VKYPEIDLLLRLAVALPAVPIPTTHYLRSNLSNAPAVAINDIGSAADFMAAIEGTIKNFNDGDLVEGIIVQVDRDEVLVDIQSNMILIHMKLSQWGIASKLSSCKKKIKRDV
jgi:hypothetical protein